MWLSELDILKHEYLEYKENRERLMNEHPLKKVVPKSSKNVVSKGPLKPKNNLVIV
jgi:hypothetical protein